MNTLRPVLAVAATTLFTLSVAAQERSYWIGNQNSNDIMEVTPWGKVLQRFDVGGPVRAAKTQPDTGLTWVLTDGSPDTIQLFDSNGPVGVTITSPHYTQFTDIDFDASGTAWAVGHNGTNTSGGVTQYNIVGAELLNVLLPELNPRGITIDSLGNKWIAHRNLFNAKVSRIDSAGVASDWPVTGVRPVNPIADFRGVGVPSHIWVQCDDNGSLIELDENGTELNNYTVAADISGKPVVDGNGFIWVRKSNDANLYQVDPATGTVTNTYPIQSPTDPSYVGVNGLGIDTLGRLLAVQRLNFGPPQPQPAPPCELQRIDPATGMMEVSTVLAFGGNEALGSVLAPSTPYHYATVVNPTGDVDGDGDSNLTEIQNGTSPVDANSDSRFSIDTTGATNVGGTLSINVRQNAGSDLWLIGYATSALAVPGTVPGFTGDLLLDPSTVFATTSGIGNSSTPVAVPTTPTLAGACVFMQGLYFDGAAFNLRNLSGFSIW